MTEQGKGEKERRKSGTRPTMTMTGENALSMFGFSDDHCHKCGVHNSEISGLLMQCAKCKKAYYCSVKCFNEDLPRHQEFCGTVGITRQPDRNGVSDYDLPMRMAPPELEAERMGKNLYRIKVSEHCDIKVKDDKGHKFSGNFEDGTYFSYTDGGFKGPSQSVRQGDKGQKVLALFGGGSLTITATNEHGKSAKVKVDPCQPSPPHIEAHQISPGLYKIIATDESGGAVTLRAQDADGNSFDRAGLKPGCIVQYNQAFDEPEKEMVKDPKYGKIHKLAGVGALKVTAINDSGKKSSVNLIPKEPGTPHLTIERLGDNLFKLHVDDTAEDGPLTIKAVDSKGNAFGLEPDAIFNYTECGDGVPHQKSGTDPDHGEMQRLHGNGDLVITVTNRFGKEATVTLKAAAALPPTINVEKVGDNLYKMTVTDPSGEAVTIKVVDGKGYEYPDSLGDQAVFSYTEAGNRPSKHEEVNDGEHGKVHHLIGQGILRITATNSAGKEALATVLPTAVLPPNVEILEVDKGIYKLIATDASGEPVTVEAFDGNGKKYQKPLTPGDLFCYDEAGDRPNQQGVKQHPELGTVQRLVGNGDLSIIVTNSAGKKAKATVEPAAPSRPKLQLEDMGDGVYKVIATDDSGEPVTIEAVDANGNKFQKSLKPGTLFSYEEAGGRPSKQEKKNHPKHGEIDKLIGNGELTITATNAAGKKAEVTVQPRTPPPPTLQVEKVGDGVYKIIATDESGEPLTIEAVDANGNKFQKPLKPGALFSYEEAGARPNKQEKKNHPNHGEIDKLIGNGDLKITATNAAGKKAEVTVQPTIAPPPQLKVEKVGDGVYKIVASDDSSEPLVIDAVDADGKKYQKLTPGTLFSYEEAGSRPSKQEDKNHPKYGAIQKLIGNGDLTLTATNSAGKKAEAKVQPSSAPPPNLKVEKLEDGLYKVVASDESGEPLVMEAADGKGNKFQQAWSPGTVFRYEEAGKRPAKQEEEDHATYGTIQKLLGNGPLVITATNPAGKKANATVQPTPAAPPTLTVEKIGDDVYKIVASDKSGDPVTIKAVDAKGNQFKGPISDGYVFKYVEAGKLPNSEVDHRDPNHGTIKKLEGQGDLKITAVNSAGKETTVNVAPTLAPPPTLIVQEIDDGVYKITASDESGDPVTVTFHDDEGEGTSFNGKPDMVLRYMTCSGPAEQTVVNDPTHGSVDNIYGRGNLLVAATNSKGKQAAVIVPPWECGEPDLKLEKVDDGVYRVVASDKSGDPVKIEAVDGDGKAFSHPLKPGDLFRWSDDGPRGDKVADDDKHGKLHEFTIPELWITCYNKAGKKKKQKVKAPAKKKEKKVKMAEPDKDFDLGEYQVDPYERDRKPEEKRVLTKEIRDKLIFWYGRLGHPDRETMKRKVAGMPKSCGITVEDVELLPWIINGRMLSTKELHYEIAEKTQDDKEDESSSSAL